MKLARLATILVGSLVLPMQLAMPAQALTVDTPNSDDSTNVVGLIVTYKKGIDLIAPNGEPTGENFASVDLENSVQLGDGLASVDFADSLSASEAQTAFENLQNDPRVESVQFNRFIELAGSTARPIAGQILPGDGVIELPIVLKTAITRASLKPIRATDAWMAGTTPRITVSWSKPTTRYSGSIVGYRVQIKVGSSWVTLKSQTSSTTRSYTTSSSYLKAGTASQFRVAPITKVYSKTYLGFYQAATATPTTAPRSVDVLEIVNNQNHLQVSWAPYSSAVDRGGLAVTYSVQVVKTSDNSAVTCAVAAPYACNTSGTIAGTNYTAKLTVTNSRGSVTITKSIAYLLAAAITTDDIKYTNQWYLKSSETYSAKVSDAWAIESGLDSVTVAVLDTGYTDHPDLPSSKVLPGYDMISSSSSANDGDGRDADAHDAGDYILNVDQSVKDSSSWHGTHVAGIIAAADNDQGILGIAPNVKILPVRVLGADGGTTADIISGIYWAAGIHRAGVPDNPNKAKVINLSIGGYSDGCDNGTEAALAAAKAAGITVITAAGNDNPSADHLAYASLSYPGNCYPTINVGASGKSGKPAFYSNFSNAPNQFNANPYGVDISAPGGDYCQGGSSAQIYSTLNTGTKGPLAATYAYEIGTSMAAPVVSGTVALMYSAKLRQNSNVTLNGAFVDSVWNALSTTSTPFASTSPMNCASTGKTSIQDGGAYGGYGVGILNAKAALDAILG
ncbi:MAG: hypothetical protein RLZZ380_1266 [Actinomycetota bacterium]|jgi:serine protease